MPCHSSRICTSKATGSHAVRMVIDCPKIRYDDTLHKRLTFIDMDGHIAAGELCHDVAAVGCTGVVGVDNPYRVGEAKAVLEAKPAAGNAQEEFILVQCYSHPGGDQYLVPRGEVDISWRKEVIARGKGCAPAGERDVLILTREGLSNHLCVLLLSYLVKSIQGSSPS